MKRNRFFKMLFFITLLVPTLTITNVLGFGFGSGDGDSTPPTVYFITPASGATLAGTVQVKVKATDSGVGMNRVEFKLGNEWKFTDSNTDDDYFIWNFNTFGEINGGYTIYVYAYDDEENVAGTQRNIYIDNTDVEAPTVSFITPASEATLDGLDGDLIETITVLATDAFSGMDHVDFYIDSIYIDTDTNTADNYFSIDFDFKSYDDDDYTLYVYAYDKANNLAQKSRNIYIETSGKPIDGVDPDHLSHPTSETYDWLNDAARHPSDPIMISIARRATGYGWRILGYGGLPVTKERIVRCLAKFTENWLTDLWLGDDTALADKDVAEAFTRFYSWMEVGEINLNYVHFDCRDISAFVTGMAMAMGVKAKMLSCEYGDARHVAAFLDEGVDRYYTYDGITKSNNGWFMVSVFGSYYDGFSDILDIRKHLSGTTAQTQEVYHFISYISTWNIDKDTYPYQETGWVGWYLQCSNPTDPYYYEDPRGPPYNYYSNPNYFEYYSDDPYGIDWSGEPYPNLPEDFV